MIRTRKVLAAGAIALIATMTMAGCTTRNDDSGGGGGSTSGADEPIRVAFVPKLQGVPYFEAMNSGGQ